MVSSTDGFVYAGPVIFIEHIIGWMSLSGMVLV